MPRLLSLADRLWRHMPMPGRFEARAVNVGPLPALEMYRAVGGRPVMKVYAYAVGETLIDCGLAPLGDAMAAWARSQGARTALLTHHHEDHSGNVGRLQAEGIPVHATALTAELVAADLPIPWYEHFAWGRPAPARTVPFPAELELFGEAVEIIPAPGHCPDQVTLWMPSRGWLFSGDVFLHERVRLFRRDEDFAGTMSTLDRLCALPIETLWCAHRPVLTGGQAALLAKREHLREIEGRVRELHRQGRSPGAIARELRLGGSRTFQVLSFGDASTTNLVNSILSGPRPRVEVTAVLARLG